MKELIDWDQQRQDVQIKYEQVVEQFQPEGMLARKRRRWIDDAGAAAQRRHLSATNLTLIDDSDRKLLDGAALRRFP